MAGVFNVDYFGRFGATILADSEQRWPCVYRSSSVEEASSPWRKSPHYVWMGGYSDRAVERPCATNSA